MNKPEYNHTGNGQYINKNTGDNLFDINRIKRLVLRNWYLFLISFPICLGSVFIYHRYTVPVYKASATLLLKSSESRQISQSDLIEGFGLSPEMRSIENQSFIIRSKKIIKKAIDRLDFGISYYQNGRFKDTELYNACPFVVEFDSVHPQLLNVPFELNFVSDNKYKLSVNAEGGQLHNYQTQAYGGRIGIYSFEKILKLDEWVTEKPFSFRVRRRSNVAISPDAHYHFLFKSHSQLAGQYRGGLGVSPYSEGSSILFISSTGTSTRKIVRFLDVLCEVILEHNLDRKNDEATRRISFIEKRLEMVGDSLENVQNRLSSYRQKNRFMGPSEFSQRLADKYYEIENQMQMLNMQEEYYGYLQSNLHPDGDIEQFLLPAVSDENTGLVTELVNQLIELQKEQELVMSVAASDNQYVKGLEGKWNVAVEMLEKAIGQVKHNITLQKNELRNEINRILVDMEKLPDLEKEFLIIDRTYKLNDAIYTFLLQKHSESQISKASNVPDNEIIDNASVTAIVSPNKNNDYKKGFMLALIIPAAFIGLKEVLNTKVRSKDDLANLLPGVPMVGMIVHNKVDAENVIKDQPHSVISESFRGVRTKLKFMAGNKDMSVIALTSSNTGEGKTFCAQNLASVFAISGKRVVLVGFDMRKPRLTALFDLEKQAGLSNYYIGQSSIEDIIYKPNGQEFAIVPAGPIPPNPSELIAGPKTEELINYLRNKFDVVVVDSPPIGLVADARLLMQYSDCNLFVVRANYTSKDHLNYTMDSILNEPIEHLGVLFNDVNASERGYGYYSAEYYGGKIEV